MTAAAPVPTVPGTGRVLPDVRMGTCAVDGVELVNAYAWSFDIRPLWQPPAQRGTDRVRPNVDGAKPLPRYSAVTKRDLAGVIVGFVAHDTGNLNGDRFAGLEQNFFYLRSALVDPTHVGDGTRTAILTLPSLATRTGPVHVVDLVPGAQADAVMLVTLSIELPLGALA